MIDGQPFLMSTDNNIDPGDCNESLPELSQLEEMCIIRAYVHMLIKRVRGYQFHYTGHCVSFIQSNIKFINTLPLLPEDIDIILLQPSSSNLQDPRYRRQFERDFRVRRGVIITWLQYLKQNHPDYYYITISIDNLSQLPDDGDATDRILTIEEQADQAPAENDVSNYLSSS